MPFVLDVKEELEGCEKMRSGNKRVLSFICLGRVWNTKGLSTLELQGTVHGVTESGRKAGEQQEAFHT